MQPRISTLEKYFVSAPGRQIDKWMHHFDVYDRHLSALRRKSPTVVEFGVQQGGSLQMWRRSFGRTATIIGIDIDPRCLTVAEGKIEIVIADQDDRAFLRRLADRVGPIDVVIDDGGQTMTQQIDTLEEMWPAASERRGAHSRGSS